MEQIDHNPIYNWCIKSKQRFDEQIFSPEKQAEVTLAAAQLEDRSKNTQG